MSRILSSIVDIRKGEGMVTSLMFAYYFLVMVTYYLLKPARDSLFLIELGARQLPLVFILIALVVAPLTGLYARASRRYPLPTLINITVGALVVMLLVMRQLLSFNYTWVFYVFYVWVSIYGILTVSQFWLMANAVFNATQAKRIFVLLGAAAILGSFAGGGVTSILLTQFSVATADLLYICVGLLVTCMILSGMIWKAIGWQQTLRRRTTRSSDQSAGFRDSVRTVRKSRHLRLLVGIIAAAMFAGTLIDYQFKTISAAAYTDARDLGAFFGQFYGALSIVSLILQIVFARRLLRWFGVGGAILVMPGALMLGSLGLAVFPILAVAVLLRGADGSLEYSIDNTARELLYLPVPLEVKERTKVFIDMFVDRWFRGMAGVLLLILTIWLDFTVSQLSIVVLVVLAIWITFCLMIRKEYVNTFRLALHRRDIDLSQMRHIMGESSTINTVLTSLESDNERQVVYALTMLESVDDARALAVLPPLLDHDSAEVRRRALSLLAVGRERPVVDGVERFLDDPDPEVRVAALHYLLADKPERRQLSDMLKSDKSSVAAAAVVWITRHGSATERNFVDRTLLERTWRGLSNDPEARRSLIRSLGAFAQPEITPYLQRMLTNDDPAVVVAAIGALGDMGDLLALPSLIELLTDRRYRAAATHAIAAYGPAVIPRLADDLTNPKLPAKLRRHIPRVLAGIPAQASVDVLIDSLGRVESDLLYYVLKALNRLRTRYENLSFPMASVDAAIDRQVQSWYAAADCLLATSNSNNDAGQLLRKSLREYQDTLLERIFRLLGLRYPSKDVYAAYLGVVSQEISRRANAIEFMENVLSSSQKPSLMPVLDRLSPAELVLRRRELYGVSFKEAADALADLIETGEPWLRCCALFSLDKPVGGRIRRLIEAAMADSHPVVAETARAAFNRCGAA